MKASAFAIKTLSEKVRTSKRGQVPFTAQAVKGTCPLLLVILWYATPIVYAGTYGENFRYDLKRGLKNTFGAPVEIPMTLQDYHERAGWPLVRQGIGLIVGTGRMLVRFGSGIVDWGVAWIPGLQKGLPVRPEALW